MFLNCIGSGPWLQECGNVCIPTEVARIMTLIYNAIKVIVPIALIFIGMLDMAKAVTSKSEDEVKKAQKLLVQKAIAGALVFVLFSGITWMLEILDSTSGSANGEKNVITCLNNLFDYDSDGTKKQQGDKSGYTNASDICVRNGYNGSLKIYNVGSTGSLSTYSYVCYKYNKYDSKCSGTANNGEKYIFSDGNAHCVVKFGNIDGNSSSSDANKAVVVDDNGNVSSYGNGMCSTASSSYCNQCCVERLNAKAGYSISGEHNECLCIK